MRQDWKLDLLNESGKTDEDFCNEIEDKWKLGLFGEEYNQEGVVPRVSATCADIIDDFCNSSIFTTKFTTK